MGIKAKFTNLEGLSAYAHACINTQYPAATHADWQVWSIASTVETLYAAKEALRAEIQRGDTSNEDRKRYREYLARFVQS